MPYAYRHIAAYGRFVKNPDNKQYYFEFISIHLMRIVSKGLI